VHFSGTCKKQTLHPTTVTALQTIQTLHAIQYYNPTPYNSTTYIPTLNTIQTYYCVVRSRFAIVRILCAANQFAVLWDLIVKSLLKQGLERWPHICCVKPRTPTDHVCITAVQLVCFHKNEFDEMLCKLDSTENPITLAHDDVSNFFSVTIFSNSRWRACDKVQLCSPGMHDRTRQSKLMSPSNFQYRQPYCASMQLNAWSKIRSQPFILLEWLGMDFATKKTYACQTTLRKRHTV